MSYPLVSETILTPEYLAAIGCVAIESTYCEIVVEKIIWELCGLDEDHGKHLTNGVQMNNRLELLSTLAKMHLSDESQKATLVKLVSDLKIANSDRNTVIHGSWSSPVENFLVLWRDGAGKHPPAVAFKRRLNNDPLTFSAANVFDVAKKIASLKVDLLNFAGEAWPETWQQISRPLPSRHEG